MSNTQVIPVLFIVQSYDVCNGKITTVCKRISLINEGKAHQQNFFSFHIMLNSRNSFQPIFFIQYSSNVKSIFVNSLRALQTIFSRENIISCVFSAFASVTCYRLGKG